MGTGTLMMGIRMLWLCSGLLVLSMLVMGGIALLRWAEVGLGAVLCFSFSLYLTEPHFCLVFSVFSFSPSPAFKPLLWLGSTLLAAHTEW